MKVLKPVRKFLLRLTIISVVCILLKIVCFETFLIPSGSMEGTVLSGDFIYVNKLFFGARMPKTMSEVPWLNLFFINRSGNFDDNLRLPGYGHIQHGDILVFNQPFNQQEYFLKRCIALPGDTFYLADTAIVINGKVHTNQTGVKYVFKVCFKPGVDYKSLFRRLQIFYNEDWSERKQPCKEVCLTQLQLHLLQKNDSVTGINRPADKTGGVWQMHIPYKGMNIQLDTANFELYKNTVLHYEGDTLQFSNGKFFLHGKMITRYIFKKNYYFMMGDNRDYSVDSRAWGLVPEELIIGKAEFVLWPVRSLNGPGLEN